MAVGAAGLSAAGNRVPNGAAANKALAGLEQCRVAGPKRPPPIKRRLNELGEALDQSHHKAFSTRTQGADPDGPGDFQRYRYYVIEIDTKAREHCGEVRMGSHRALGAHPFERAAFRGFTSAQPRSSGPTPHPQGLLCSSWSRKALAQGGRELGSPAQDEETISGCE